MGICILKNGVFFQEYQKNFAIACSSYEPSFPSSSKEKVFLWIKTLNSNIEKIIFTGSLPIYNALDKNIYILAEGGVSNPQEIFFEDKHGTKIFKILGAVFQNDGNAFKKIDAYWKQPPLTSNPWIQFSKSNVYFYNKGDSCQNVTGNWTTIKAGSKSTVTFGPSSINFQSNGSFGADAIIRTMNQIDCQSLGIKTLKCSIDISKVNSPENFPMSFGLLKTDQFSDRTQDWVTRFSITKTTNSTEVLSIDVSDIVGKYYVGFYIFGQGEIHEVWGE